MTRITAVALLLLTTSQPLFAQPTPTHTTVRPSPTLANSHAEPGTHGCAIGPWGAGAEWPAIGLLALGLRRVARRRGRL